VPTHFDITLQIQTKRDTHELLGLKPPKVQRIDDDSDARRLWKRFQRVSSLPERDQKAVLRLINSLVSVTHGRRAARAG
jgi:hypothetical protein